MTATTKRLTEEQAYADWKAPYRSLHSGDVRSAHRAGYRAGTDAALTNSPLPECVAELWRIIALAHDARGATSYDLAMSDVQAIHDVATRALAAARAAMEAQP